MLKKELVVTNPFTGEQVIETVYLNLTKAELQFMDAKYESDGGFSNILKNTLANRDINKMCQLYKDVILTAYGKRVGNSLVKNEEFRNEFLASEAFSCLYMDLIEGKIDSGEFMNAILPKIEVEQKLTENAQA